MATRLSLDAIDQSLALTLAAAANAAYPTVSYTPPNPPPDPTPPSGYDFVQFWWGKDPSYIFGGDQEVYGAIFRGNETGNKNTVILAFKGTNSKWDAYEDIWAERVSFSFHDAPSAGTDVHVAAGFADIYVADSSAGGGTMQAQLYSYLSDNHQSIDKLYITGHSLGSSLAELFTMDLRNSMKQNAVSWNFEVYHYNYACPRVGNESFVSFYNDLEASLPAAQQTVRFVNYFDFVPCLPPATILDYKHGPAYFLFSFEWNVKWYWKVIHPVKVVMTRHSVANYETVLREVAFKADTNYPAIITGYEGRSLYCPKTGKDVKECTRKTSFWEWLLRWLYNHLP